eukprot:15334050-Ditylum_brightwellii.AAC.1
MSVLVNLWKHHKAKDAESSSGFNPLAIPFIPRALSLKLENVQEFSLWVSPAEKKSTYKYKALSKVIKNKPVDAADGRFDLVRALLEGDVLMHWQEFKWVETSRTSKNPDGTDTALTGMCDDTFKACFQELKKHYFPKRLARLQKAYLRNHIRKRNKLSIKNTAARLRDVNSMLAHFLALDNKPMADNELCNILYWMVKHKWQEALRKSGCLSLDMSVADLVDYFEQIQLLDVIKKKKSKTITADDDSNKNEHKSKISHGDNNTNKKMAKEIQKEKLNLQDQKGCILSVSACCVQILGETLELMTLSIASVIK